MNNFIKPTVLLLVAVLFVGLTVYAMSLFGLNDGELYTIIVLVSSVIGVTSGMFVAIWVDDRIRIAIRKHKDKRTHLSLIVGLIVLSGMFVSCEQRSRATVVYLKPQIDSIFVVNIVYNQYADFSSHLMFEYYIQASDKFDADRIFCQTINPKMSVIESYTIRPEKLWK